MMTWALASLTSLFHTCGFISTRVWLDMDLVAHVIIPLVLDKLFST